MARKAIVLGLVALIALQGCSCWEKKHTTGTLVGAAGGAGLGALIGSVSGSWVWGGIIGLGAGALAGYLIAEHFVDSCCHKAGYRSTFETTTVDRSRELAEEEFRLAMQAGDARSSEEHVRKSLAHHPTAPAWNNLGLLQVQDGRRLDAQDSFNRALALDPGYEAARRNLDKLRAGRPEPALARGR
jgi:Tfp pilus assembly protein PilF